MSTNDRPVLAVDIGGTKMAAALLDPAGRVRATRRLPTPPGADAETLWRTLSDLLAAVVADAGPEGTSGVGIGCSGPMDWPAGVVSPLNMTGWAGFPLRERVAALYPDGPVRLHNDAVCVAVGEHWRGAGKGADNVLGMVVSTGVGGGLVLGGRLVDGASGNAGHIGHVVVDPDGPACACGGRGCLEAIARGPAVVAWAQEQGWRSGTALTGVDLAEDARRGHPVALAALSRAGRALGVAIATATHLLDLEVVSIGGALSQAGPLLFGPLEQAFAAHARMAFTQSVRIVPAALGQESGLVGAGALVAAGERYWTAD